MDNIFVQSASWFGLLGTIGLSMATYLANRYVIPFLRIGKRKQYARYIADIADEVTDDLRGTYPRKAWLSHLDEAVDQLIQICNINEKIAQRAVRAAAARK